MVSTWRDFLLKRRYDTGENQTHLFFLQNLAAGKGSLPTKISDRVNYYLLRTVDFTPTYTESGDLGIYSKIGPIAFFTSLKPPSLKNTPDSRIGMRGKLYTVQRILNTSICNFIFINRPNDALAKMEISEKQQEIMERSYNKDIERSKNSMTIRAFEADIILRQLKFMQEGEDEFYL
jgi:hypothetical protein